MEIEFQILDFLQGIRTPILDQIMRVITSLGNAGMIWIILAIILLTIRKTRKVGMMLITALILDFIICNLFFKNVVARTRPFDINTSIDLLISKPRDFSFPSGHTAASVVATTVLYLNKYKIIWKVAAFLTILIAFSRLYLYVHFPTDILGGVMIGIITGYIGYKLVVSVDSRKRRENKVSK